MRSARRLCLAISFVALSGQALLAQQPAAAPALPPPPPTWTGLVGAGLTLTRGNVDTTNVNLSFDVKYTPTAANIFKAEGLYLRGKTNGDDTANRLALQFRVEHPISDRAFLFGQMQFARDPFKGVDYLVAPTVGAGYKIIDTPTTQFSADTSVGLVFEKNPLVNVQTSPAWTAGEKFSYKVSPTATVTESAQGLWKLNHFGDTLYTFGVGLTTTITPRSQLKAELLDTFKTTPPAGHQSNDLAVLVSLVFKY